MVEELENTIMIPISGRSKYKIFIKKRRKPKMSDKYLDLPGLQRYHNLAKEHFVEKEVGKGL